MSSPLIKRILSNDSPLIAKQPLPLFAFVHIVASLFLSYGPEVFMDSAYNKKERKWKKSHCD